MSLDARLFVQLAATLTSALDLTTASAPSSISRQINFADGVGAGQANLLWTDTRTLAPSATDSIDLAGTLTDPFGAAIAFARIKGVLVKAATTNVTDVQVTRPATNAVPLLSAAAYIPVPPGGLLAWFDPSAAGVVVTAGTGDLLNLVNSGATAAKYDIAIIGAAS